MRDNKLLKILCSEGLIEYLHILTTPKCNFNCKYCIAKSVMNGASNMLKDMRSKKAKEWTKKFLRGSLELIDNYDGDEVLLTGGEPLLTTELDKYPYIEYYISHAAKSGNKNRTIRVITNGFTIPTEKKKAMAFFEKIMNLADPCKFKFEISYDKNLMVFRNVLRLCFSFFLRNSLLV